jgi:hypothetical protein
LSPTIFLASSSSTNSTKADPLKTFSGGFENLKRVQSTFPCFSKRAVTSSKVVSFGNPFCFKLLS